MTIWWLTLTTLLPSRYTKIHIIYLNQTHPEQKLVNFSSNSDINLISKRHKCSTTMLLFIYLFSELATSWVESPTAKKRRLHRLTETDCWHFRAYKLGDYLQTFCSLSENVCSQPELSHNCLDTVFLPPNNLWNLLRSKAVTQMLRMLHVQLLGDLLVTLIN